MRDIGKNIRDLRERSGLTQEALAEKLFVTRQTVSNYETGKTRPDLDMLIKIADTLGTDANTVLYGIPQPPERRQARLRLCIATGIFLALFVALLILLPIAQALSNQYRTTLGYFVSWIMVPTVWTLGGFCLMELIKLALITQLRPLPGAKWIRLSFWIFWGVCLALLLPFGIMSFVADIRLQLYGSVSLSFSMGKVLDWLSFCLMGLARESPAIFSLTGILFSLMCVAPQLPSPQPGIKA